MERINQVQELLAGITTRFEQPEAGRVDAYIQSPWQLPEGTRSLLAIGFLLTAITGMDLPQTNEYEGGTELLYHFSSGPIVATMRFRVTYGDPLAPTICDIIPSATLYEREVMEMYGVLLESTPDRSRLLLSDDWPDGVYPMRKSFKGLES